MSFDSARALMSKLEIDHSRFSDPGLDDPFNNWLAVQGKKHILAGTIPDIKSNSHEEAGMILMTQFVVSQRRLELEEDDRDKEVKQWLVNECEMKPDELEWLCFFDKYFLTLNGIEPKFSDRGLVPRPPPNVITDEDAVEWRKADTTLTFLEFCDMRREKERAEKEAEKKDVIPR